MTEFTPLEALIGGGLIGLAAILLMAIHGRIAGISSVLSGLLPPAIAPDWRWRAALLSGMAASPVLYWLILGDAPTLQIEASNGLLLASGIIVGIGVTYGSGCTSGHGVCGLARLSPSSIAATLTFMATAAITVFIVRHVIGA